ncbi:MAG: bifunctional adenosylcobinamide kinase/adenosylcobinamide-phosphate guanylyltransferase [Lachnospiraceae bacterium]|nr:bifunctional adenosylcobinamide kinase/adenosylcobinamide-phosphate guanylyltransferase [Lachnospiraceae bacterium]
MILVVGGANQGKTFYASEKFQISHWIFGGDCDMETVCLAPGICHFELLVERMIRKGENPKEFAEKLIKLNPDIIIITNELGCGLVPMDAFFRRYREEHGRVCTFLAAQAKEVHRVFCGIGTVIKG